MRRLVCLTFAAGLLALLLGCGEDPVEPGVKQPLEVVSTIPEDGATVAGNMTLTVTLNNKMESAEVLVTGGRGTTTVAGKVVTWTPSGDMPPGPHTMTVTGVDVFGQEVVEFKPIDFITTEA